MKSFSFIAKSFKNTIAIAGMITGTVMIAGGTYFTLIDLMWLNTNYAAVQEQALKSSPAKAAFLYHREAQQRINVFADATWTFMGIIVGLQSTSLLYQDPCKKNNDNI